MVLGLSYYDVMRKRLFYSLVHLRVITESCLAHVWQNIHLLLDFKGRFWRKR